MIKVSESPWVLLSGRQDLRQPESNVTCQWHFPSYTSWASASQSGRQFLAKTLLVGHCSWQVAVTGCSQGQRAPARAQVKGESHRHSMSLHEVPLQIYVWDPEVRMLHRILWIHVVLPRGGLVYQDWQWQTSLSTIWFTIILLVEEREMMDTLHPGEVLPPLASGDGASDPKDSYGPVPAFVCHACSSPGGKCSQQPQVVCTHCQLYKISIYRYIGLGFF